jgi:hypothetical protein
MFMCVAWADIFNPDGVKLAVAVILYGWIFGTACLEEENAGAMKLHCNINENKSVKHDRDLCHSLA